MTFRNAKYDFKLWDHYIIFPIETLIIKEMLWSSWLLRSPAYGSDIHLTFMREELLSDISASQAYLLISFCASTVIQYLKRNTLVVKFYAA